MQFISLLAIFPVTWQLAVQGVDFDSRSVNITAVKGQSTILPCAVNNKLDKQIIWMNPRRILISTEDRRVIDDTRMSIERPYVQDWNLHIRSVQVYDDGEYTCQINTDPIQIKRIRLKVQVPAEIVNATPGDIRVNEGQKVELTCQATGIPDPSITWYRKTAQTNNAREHVGTTGELLRIHNISRYCGGVYECEASNNIAPPSRKVMHIQVEFAPEVRFKTPRRISQEVGKEALLECFVAAFPHGVSTWTKNGDELIGADESRWKYRTEVYQEDTFTIALYLRILNLEPEDFGTYSCEASNSLGSDKDTILLYEYVKPTPQPSTTRMTPRSPDLAVPRYGQNWHVGRTEINTGERPHAVSGTSHISGFVGASDSIRPSNGAKYLHQTTFSGHMQTTIALAIIKYALYLRSVMS